MPGRYRDHWRKGFVLSAFERLGSRDLEARGGREFLGREEDLRVGSLCGAVGALEGDLVGLVCLSGEGFCTSRYLVSLKTFWSC